MIRTIADAIFDFIGFCIAALCSVFLFFAGVVFVGFLLSGCATAPPQPPIVAHATALEPQRIPVLVPCLKPGQIPKPPATSMRPEQSREKAEQAAELDFRELDRYIVQSQSLMWACADALEEGK